MFLVSEKRATNIVKANQGVWFPRTSMNIFLLYSPVTISNNFQAVQFKEQETKNNHIRSSWCANRKENKEYIRIKEKKRWKEKGKYWPEFGFWDGLTKRKGKQNFKECNKNN